MDSFLLKGYQVNKNFNVKVEKSLSLTYLNLKQEDPVFAKLVFGFCLADGEPVSYPNDVGKIAFPMYQPICPSDSLLLNAIASGGDNVEFLMHELGHDIDAHEYKGKNALHYALQSDILWLISELVDRGLSLLSVPIEVNLSEQTCGFIFKQPNVVSILDSWFRGPMKEKLIEMFIDHETDKCFTALQRSILIKDDNKSLFLLRNGTKDSWLQVHSNCGTNAIHFALQAGSLKVLKVLILEKKMDLTAKDGQGRPSLSWLTPMAKKESIWFLMSLPNWDSIKTANKDTYFIKTILPKYEENVSLLKVCLQTASLFAEEKEEKLEVHFLKYVQTLTSMTELKKSIETGKEYLPTPEMKKFMADCLRLYF